jgi:hypothetical protein
MFSEFSAHLRPWAACGIRDPALNAISEHLVIVWIARHPFRTQSVPVDSPLYAALAKVFRFNFHQSGVSPPSSGRTLPNEAKWLIANGR